MLASCMRECVSEIAALFVLRRDRPYHIGKAQLDRKSRACGSAPSSST